ncbi:hypothetical protein ILUMI_12440 [Ignelater luminosus]|uniref:DUF4729 domain-containing protein n=1 Tax=Ignelater luminosus TaxID=2038154 RepID=A0A8K0GCB6_IGNLU|nr:hypothetical protein ILUMI_12440 [Ignelater luminosus]
MMKSSHLMEINSFTKGKFCTVCREIPEFSRLYKCNMGGHIICYSCFNKLPKSRGARCSECNSVFLKIHGTHLGSDEDQKKSVTVEELFQLPTEQVNLLLNKNSQEKLDGDETLMCNSSNNNNNNNNADLVNVIKKNHQTANSVPICKPFKCPHLPCGKTVNSSSLKVHFIYEHPDIMTYLIKRGEELHIASNVAVIEYGMTYCIAMIEVYDEYKVVSRAIDGLYKKLNQKVPVAIFWLLVSGSTQRENSKAYALYWLVTDSELPFKCTLEMSSSSDSCSCATFCGVNDIRDDLSTANIANKMNCLYLSYGSLLNLKGQWGEVNLRITIH